MTFHAPIETREAGGPYALLAKKTGLSVAEIEGIAERGELRALIDQAYAQEGRDPHAALRELERKRWPKSGRQAFREILEKRWPQS